MVITIEDDFDLAAIAGSGQCFRWESPDVERWRIVHGGQCLYISRVGERTYELDCDETSFESVWRTYFDLETCYGDVRKMIDPEADPFLFRAAETGKGIRILRQDPWETAVSFIISQNRNIPAIKRSVEMLCRIAGERRTDNRNAPFYTFPTPQAIVSVSQEDLTRCRLGYREKYVMTAAQAAAEGRFSPERMETLSDGELIEALCGLYGVGAKVASCIALFGFHRLDAFPVDTWIRKALENEYPDGFPADRYRPFNGVYQQYIFAYYREKTV